MNREYDRWKTTDPVAEADGKQQLEQDRRDHSRWVASLPEPAQRLYWAERDYRRAVARAYRDLPFSSRPLARRISDRLPLPADWKPGRSYHGPPRCGCPDSRDPAYR